MMLMTTTMTTTMTTKMIGIARTQDASDRQGSDDEVTAA